MKFLPKIDELIMSLSTHSICGELSNDILKKLCQRAVDEKRKEIAKADKNISRNELTEQIMTKVSIDAKKLLSPQLCKVINATGVVLHTNLGRAPLCTDALYNIVNIAEGYSNLEFDVETGKRGSRYEHLKEMTCLLTGAEDIVVVNNNAAAVLLSLETLSHGKETIVSRGELVEIGGEFRIPDVMSKSGAILKEVGTTNRTRISDYESAINENTGLILKVHTSNFKIVGFSEDVSINELVSLGKKHGIPVVYDLGSGCLLDLHRYGITTEPVIGEVLASGIDIVTISGDKLLGGPQAGIILGKKEYIATIRKNPLNRALRIDKLSLASLEATLSQYLRTEDFITSNIITLKYLTRTAEEIKKSAKALSKRMQTIKNKALNISIIKGVSFAGGGTLPDHEIETYLVAISHASISSEIIATKMRTFSIPVIARVANDELLFDLRTIEKEDFATIVVALENAIDNE